MTQNQLSDLSPHNRPAEVAPFVASFRYQKHIAVKRSNDHENGGLIKHYRRGESTSRCGTASMPVIHDSDGNFCSAFEATIELLQSALSRNPVNDDQRHRPAANSKLSGRRLCWGSRRCFASTSSNRMG